ncbi:MAG TPA: hypothetical protein VFX14_02295 [Methylomirabilota bacterium]|nr:hypothetical protein [Methylomirabilota bacterium]
MKALALGRDGLTPARLVGRIAAHDVRGMGGKIIVRKGQLLDAATAALALEAPWSTPLHVLELEPGDIHEEPAGSRLAQAAAGPGVQVKGYGGGQWTLAAARRGLVRVRDRALREVNTESGIAVFTLWDLQPVDADEVVAKAKVTPLAIAESVIKHVESLAWAAGGLLTVQGFESRLIGAISRESLEPRQRERFESALQEKMDWFGSRLLPVRYSGGDAAAVAATIEGVIGEGADLVIVAGASALDPLDPVFLGIEAAGGHMERHGVPAHPGSLLFLADIGGRPVLGMPTCGMFSQATTFDLVLPRLLTGEPVGNLELAGLGEGGLMSGESAWRFPPYRKNAARGELGE